MTTVVHVGTAGTTTTTRIGSIEETEIVTSGIEIVISATEMLQGLGKGLSGTTEIEIRALGRDIRAETIGEILAEREIPWRKTRESERETLIQDQGLAPGKSTTRSWMIDEPSLGSGSPTTVGTPTKGGSLH